MKAPVGLLSDRTVLRSKMEGPRPDKFTFAQWSGAMKAPVGLLSDRTVLRSKMEGPCPDKFTLYQRRDRIGLYHIPQTQFADVPAITQHPLNRIVGHLPAH